MKNFTLKTVDDYINWIYDASKKVAELNGDDLAKACLIRDLREKFWSISHTINDSFIQELKAKLYSPSIKTRF